MQQVPHAGTALHLQEFFRIEPASDQQRELLEVRRGFAFGKAPAIVPTKNVQGDANAAIRQRRPPIGHLSEGTYERRKKGLLFEAFSV